MTSDRVALALFATVATMALAAGGCRDPEDHPVRAKVRPLEEQMEQGRAALSDPQVVAPLTTPRAPGRILYDAPPDLSYASLQQRRPDLLRSFDPAAAAAADRRGATASPLRDTTGGDAAVIRSRRDGRDTSGASRP